VTDVVLEVADVAVHFGGVAALKGVSLAVEKGSRWAVIGPNGAGKTTLFRVIAGEVHPDTGRVHLFGRDTTGWAPYSKAQLGLARTYQVTNLFQALTVEENLAIAALAPTKTRFVSWRRLRMQGWVDETIAKVLGDVGLTHRRHDLVSEMSHGEQRQLEIGMTLASNPQLILLDEPAAGLSSAERRLMADLIRSLPPELTIVMIEHDMDIALDLVERVLVLDNGSPIAEGTPDEIRGNPTVQAVYLKSD
jgi:branched-chain amino acid transport system ATP-binding protein